MRVVAALTDGRLTVTTAESCTGGWIAKALTDVAGSSACFEYGVVSYSDEAKVNLLGVRRATLDAHGAVSEATVREMAEGALARSGADIAVAVSGIAGPGGGSEDKPVGTVWLAWTVRGADGVRTEAVRQEIAGDRLAVRRGTVTLALEGIGERIGSHGG